MTDREILELHWASCRGEITSQEFVEKCADGGAEMRQVRRVLFWDTVRFGLKCMAIAAAVWAASDVMVLLLGH